MLTAVTAPGAAAADDGVRPLISTSCQFGNTWVVTGNWDGVGGDGIGVVRNEGGVLKWYLRDSATAGPHDHLVSYGSPT